VRLKLAISNQETLTNGGPVAIDLDRRGAVVGRSPTVDWHLPDANNVISSQHCAISFRNDKFFLTDISTNGTQINGKAVQGQQQLRHGDTLKIGHYLVAVALVQSAAPASPPHLAPAVDPAPAIQEPEKPQGARSVWIQMADDNVVDWARGGFGQPFAPDDDADQIASKSDRSAPRAASSPHNADALIDVLLASAGLLRTDIAVSEASLQASTGRILRRLVSGLVVMLEARARAKMQMGAQATNIQFEGNNPLKFSRTPEHALAQLLNPPARGFMGSDRAIEDAFFDLQAHQLATLKAMQGALRATLDLFSPSAIRQRSKGGSWWANLFPSQRDAALWKTYEREFNGVTMGSDEAFMQVFATEFRKAYEEQAGRQSRSG
jgi:type VI secretion system protein